MPWIAGTDEQPARYAWPKALPDSVVLASKKIMDYANEQRKQAAQLREALISVQKSLGKPIPPSFWKKLWYKIIRKTIVSDQKWLSDESSYWLKVQRGWESAIGMIEGKRGYDNWRNTKIQEEISSYVDRAFGILDLYSYSNPQ